MRRFAIVAAVLSLLALPVASASGATFVVTSTVDSTATPCTSAGPGVLNCTSLRRAVQEAQASADATDEIVLGAGRFTLTGGELVLPSGVGIIGASPRTTIIDGGFTARALHVPIGATEVLLTRLTVDEGRVVGANGGNILNEGELSLFQAAITGGRAENGSGGGIANSGGDLFITQSLIEGNSATFSGGGIDNAARSGIIGRVDVTESTLTGNEGSTGSAIGTGNPGNEVQLDHVTLAHNVPGTGITIATAGQTVEVRASIFYTNTTTYPNCGASRQPTDLGYNVESADTCLFRGTGSKPSVDPLLSGGLVNAGGPTDLFTIASGSPAENAATQCGSVIDQRGYQRDANLFAACDAGAYEIGGQPFSELPPDPGPMPTPEPTVAAPVQTPAPAPPVTPVPTPVAGQSVAVEPVRGKVLVKVPGSKTFVPLDLAVIKNGTEVDVKSGAVEITRADGGRAVFDGGRFKLSTSRGVTVLTLSEPLDCKTGKRSLAAKKTKTRKLWGDGKGAFRTAGKYSAATVRGTKWLVQDTCTTTTTRVTVGTVEVRDQVRGKTVVLRKGKSYVARARK